ncbi:short chain dehydrogenase family protein [Mycobacterium xenopi 4042]|uniref:Short chain dehydrogenase family protein n=1 Tax=Mycobacterium xenopi 4042 TaxID=1299334 RepID=X8DMH1_MYCXE|nr:short chain dehydrogenase family protein [Mycobacterium xenopi 4042]
MTIAPADKRVAVVTGASSGIGAATARTLAGQGFHVVAVARRADRVAELADEIGGTAVVADVTDDTAVDALARGLSRVDVLVNNAGGAKGSNRSPTPTSSIGAGCGRPMCWARCG